MIYLDHHATTPVDPLVLEAMLPFFHGHAGNAASRNHAAGRRASEAVESARAAVGALIAAPARSITFTSGATESNNLAIKGVVEAHRLRGQVAHVITQRTEHKAVLDSLRHLEARGEVRTSVLDVDREGRVDPAAVEAAIEEDTCLVSIMWTNNETGAHSDLTAIARRVRAHGVYLHIDASQGLGYLPLDVDALGADLVSYTAHKIYGPKGVGALYVRRANPRVRIVAQMDGGGQEHGLRGGTLNVPAIVGFGKAAAILKACAAEEAERLARLRHRLYRALPACEINGPALGGSRHPANLNVAFTNVRAADLLVRVGGELAISSGSACSTGRTAPSHVLTAMGLSSARAAASIRFGLGRETSEADIDRSAELLGAALEASRIEAKEAPDFW